MARYSSDMKIKTHLKAIVFSICLLILTGLLLITINIYCLEDQGYNGMGKVGDNAPIKKASSIRVSRWTPKGSTLEKPSLARSEDIIVSAVRGTDNGLYVRHSFDKFGRDFSYWIYQGSTLAEPQLSYTDRFTLLILGTDYRIYEKTSFDGLYWTNANLVSDVGSQVPPYQQVCETPFSDVLFQSFIDNNQSIYVRVVNQTEYFDTGWLKLSGLGLAPAVPVCSTFHTQLQNVVIGVRGIDNGIYVGKLQLFDRENPIVWNLSGYTIKRLYPFHSGFLTIGSGKEILYTGVNEFGNILITNWKNLTHGTTGEAIRGEGIDFSFSNDLITFRDVNLNIVVAQIDVFRNSWDGEMSLVITNEKTLEGSGLSDTSSIAFWTELPNDIENHESTSYSPFELRSENLRVSSLNFVDYRKQDDEEENDNEKEEDNENEEDETNNSNRDEPINGNPNPPIEENNDYLIPDDEEGRVIEEGLFIIQSVRGTDNGIYTRVLINN